MGAQAIKRWLIVMLVFCAVLARICYAQIDKPQLLKHFDEMTKIVTLPDGRLMALFISQGGPGLPPVKEKQEVRARYSNDNGETWSGEQILFTLPASAGGFGYYLPMVDHNGEVHIAMLNDGCSGHILPLPKGVKNNDSTAEGPLNIWYIRSSHHRTQWKNPKQIWKGRSGDLLSMIQLRSGRIILPISYETDRSWSNRGNGPDLFTYMGTYNCGALYSDDGGESWIESPDVLKAPAVDNDTFGPIEPVVIQLKDGRVWMLIRTQMKRFYESFSQDGSRWSIPKPTSIISSDSPAGLMRLANGHLLMFVNSCMRYAYAYGGRQVLHAAVSEDEGKTWLGYREVLRDPLQKDGPPAHGDNGVAYPFPTLTKDGRVVFSLWVETGRGRSIFRFDPRWLYEKSQRDDFKLGLINWSTFGTEGVELVPDPLKKDAKIMSIQKKNDVWEAGAVWNFPKGGKGYLKCRIMLRRGFGGVRIALTDHFSAPFDGLAQYNNLFDFKICPNGELSVAPVTLQAMHWYEVSLKWDCSKRYCWLFLDKVQVAKLDIQRTGSAVNYLRLGSTSEHADQGILIEYVDVKVDR